MVLQRYALRFTISDAILDSLKLPRAASRQPDEEHRASSPRTDSEPVTLEERHEQMETGEAVSTVTKSGNQPPQTLELNDVQAKQVTSTTRHTELVSGGAQTQTKHAPSQTRHVQPHTPQQAPTLPSPPCVPPRPVPLLVAKPYCQPKNTQPGHKPVKVRSQALILLFHVLWITNLLIVTNYNLIFVSHSDGRFGASQRRSTGHFEHACPPSAFATGH